ncbi:PepSY domain-containing protein [Bradyrhizobium sp. 38]|uniref:PepSY domain-containing protein n=1 Tax=unclassified Bradyrhizobium TaxID=2631580 RepID=UPI001FF987DA|nr:MULTISPECIES: PepSY domain-containing protein [unclassified Bradyrhizobium]MCK1339647.1 PepSY domain-containing protein [Bradyrhizobium sp. 38]MCK1779642.1 PepSY domain-containing protein [Bradyrhizobium sp. 132]
MRNLILPAVVAIGLGSAAPAVAYDTGDQISMQAALDVASDIGVMTISQTEFAGDEWQIEGRDSVGRWMEVDVDARTGEVRNVDRGW